MRHKGIGWLSAAWIGAVNMLGATATAGDFPLVGGLSAKGLEVPFHEELIPPQDGLRTVVSNSRVGLADAVGYPQGLYSYELCLLRGIGGAPDVPQGERLLLKAAEAGVSEAQYEAAVMLFQGGQTVKADIPRGVKLMLAAAEAGHADAQANVADFRAVGELLPADPVAALDWARRSAEQGSQMGLINYGDFLLRGVGGTANPQGAALLEQAVALGEPYGAHAALTLGQYYRDGRYLPRDPERARRWLLQARDMGHPEADKELAMLR